MTWPFVAGLGSHHGDDQAGWLVVDRLRDRGFPGERLAQLRHPVDLMDVMDVTKWLVVCDACSGSGQPGTIRHMCWPLPISTFARIASDEGHGLSIPIKTTQPAITFPGFSGSHDLSLDDVMELAQQLGTLPVTAEIWTLEGNAWVPGSGPSDEIQSAVGQVADAIWEGCRNA